VPLGRSGCRRARHGGVARGARGGPAIDVRTRGGRGRGRVHGVGVEAESLEGCRSGASRRLPRTTRSVRVDCGWGGGGR
jgi:hypothetical protein